MRVGMGCGWDADEDGMGMGAGDDYRTTSSYPHPAPFRHIPPQLTPLQPCPHAPPLPAPIPGLRAAHHRRSVSTQTTRALIALDTSEAVAAPLKRALSILASARVTQWLPRAWVGSEPRESTPWTRCATQGVGMPRQLRVYAPRDPCCAHS